MVLIMVDITFGNWKGDFWFLLFFCVLCISLPNLRLHFSCFFGPTASVDSLLICICVSHSKGAHSACEETEGLHSLLRPASEKVIPPPFLTTFLGFHIHLLMWDC